MSDAWEEYVKDPKPICKYGSKCYQRNPQHHATFKHPPNLKDNRNKNSKHRFSPYTKKEKNTPNVDESKEDKRDPGHNGEHSKTADTQETKIHKETNKVPKIQNDVTFYDSTTNIEVLKELFLVEMPSDFFKLYECLNCDDSIEKTLASVNLQLIGPYELLLGKLPKVQDKELYLIHWRFFYDPPEFQSILKKKSNSQFHIGYYRDDPKEQPVFLASNDSSKDYIIKPMAENIFGAIYLYLENEKKSSPFTAMACQKLMETVKKYAINNNYSIEEYNMKKRLSKIVTKTFHGAGIVVPYNKNTQLGYRRLVETDANLKKIFKKFKEAQSQKEKDSILSEIQPVITYASIAVDECDFGTGIEAGIDLFCSGIKELEQSALCSLTAAYSLLAREPYTKIIQAHLKSRRQGSNMSMLSFND